MITSIIISPTILCSVDGDKFFSYCVMLLFSFISPLPNRPTNSLAGFLCLIYLTIFLLLVFKTGLWPAGLNPQMKIFQIEPGNLGLCYLSSDLPAPSLPLSTCFIYYQYKGSLKSDLLVLLPSLLPWLQCEGRTEGIAKVKWETLGQGRGGTAGLVILSLNSKHHQEIAEGFDLSASMRLSQRTSCVNTAGSYNRFSWIYLSVIKSYLPAFFFLLKSPLSLVLNRLCHCFLLPMEQLSL